MAASAFLKKRKKTTGNVPNQNHAQKQKYPSQGKKKKGKKANQGGILVPCHIKLVIIGFNGRSSQSHLSFTCEAKATHFSQVHWRSPYCFVTAPRSEFTFSSSHKMDAFSRPCCWQTCYGNTTLREFRLASALAFYATAVSSSLSRLFHIVVHRRKRALKRQNRVGVYASGQDLLLLAQILKINSMRFFFCVLFIGFVLEQYILLRKAMKMFTEFELVLCQFKGFQGFIKI